MEWVSQPASSFWLLQMIKLQGLTWSFTSPEDPCHGPWLDVLSWNINKVLNEIFLEQFFKNPTNQSVQLASVSYALW